MARAPKRARHPAGHRRAQRVRIIIPATLPAVPVRGAIIVFPQTTPDRGGRVNIPACSLPRGTGSCEIGSIGLDLEAKISWIAYPVVRQPEKH